MLVATEKLAYYIPPNPHVTTTQIEWIPNLPTIDHSLPAQTVRQNKTKTKQKVKKIQKKYLQNKKTCSILINAVTLIA